MESVTPLYEEHKALGANLVPFAGFLLPIQYESGIVKEHLAVRRAAGLFDVSHMGELLLKGKDVEKSLNYLLTNNFSGMEYGQARYSLLCNKNGGVVDDVIVYRLDGYTYLVVVNASNTKKDYEFFKKEIKDDTTVTDVSGLIAQIALQGPSTFAILSKLLAPLDLPVRYYHVNQHVKIADIPCMISRTGYTGEDGVELYIKNEDAVSLWRLLLETGKENGLIPCGLGARDTLRLEAGMPLYGHELSEEITPIEAGLSRFVKFNKIDFIGKQVLEHRFRPSKVRVGILSKSRQIIREGAELYDNGELVGVVTSGTYSPSLQKGIAMAYVKKDRAEIKKELIAVVRNQEVPAVVVNLPFYKKRGEKE